MSLADFRQFPSASAIFAIFANFRCADSLFKGNWGDSPKLRASPEMERSSWQAAYVDRIHLSRYTSPSGPRRMRGTLMEEFDADVRPHLVDGAIPENAYASIPSNIDTSYASRAVSTVPSIPSSIANLRLSPTPSPVYHGRLSKSCHSCARVSQIS